LGSGVTVNETVRPCSTGWRVAGVMVPLAPADGTTVNVARTRAALHPAAIEYEALVANPLGAKPTQLHARKLVDSACPPLTTNDCDSRMKVWA